MSCATWHNRTGTTLLEVLAGLAILGVSLTGLLAAKARHLRQWATAQQRLEATAAAEELLAAWWQAPDKWPRNDSGPVPGRPAWTWRTRATENTGARELGAQVVRLEIVGREGEGPAEVLAGVELALPDAPAEAGAGERP